MKIRSNWVYRNLCITSGFFAQNKMAYTRARLVVKCEQKNEIDYQETYSPVMSQNALRSIFAIAAAKECEIITFDVKTAFLYEELEDEVYMCPPKGYNYKRKILKLKKALYGLKQAPLRWNMRFTNFLKKKSFIPIQSEQRTFKRSDSDIILSIYPVRNGTSNRRQIDVDSINFHRYNFVEFSNIEI